MPTSARLDPDTERRLGALARATGRSRAYYIRAAIAEHIGDLEDIYLAATRLEDWRAGRGKTYTLEEVARERGLAH